MMDDTFDKGSFFEGRRSSKITDADELIPRNFGSVSEQGWGFFATLFAYTLVTALLAGPAFVSPAWADGASADTANAIDRREVPFCAPNEKNRHGLEMGASATAMEYSAENYGAVGIYIAEGNDMNGYSPQQLGQFLINYFADADIEAECFISPRKAANGTALDFKVNNLSWGYDRMLNLQEGTDRTVLDDVIASARMGLIRDQIAATKD